MLEKESMRKLANCIRFLSADAVEKAKSGHPGMPMGMADVATVLFTKHLKYLSAEPDWPDRDRFILSAGHGSMLLYALLHLTGYKDFTLDDLKNFRQLDSKTAGHPEYGHGKGIETTTGPLGQGLATSIGMAIAEKKLNSRFSDDLVDHRTYALVGDGCLMEGISHEAMSLAGHLKLNKLIVLFDNNGISIDGETDLTVSDDHIRRVEAYGWKTIEADGHDFDSIDRALVEAKESNDKPVFISFRTSIGFGSPNKAGTEGVHGAPLGKDEIAATRKNLGWDHEPFVIPDSLRQEWMNAGKLNQGKFESWKNTFGNEGKELASQLNLTVPAEVRDRLMTLKQKFSAEKTKIASRKASETVINTIADCFPGFLGGSADLTGSNLTKAKTQKTVTPDDFSGEYVHYGVREHMMGAAMNGIALHKGFRPYGGTFFVFSDYLKPSLRLSCLMNLPVIYVLTHDSIGLGEDGPTHQPVEHLNSLRSIPGLNVYRPADAVETAECWLDAIESGKPSALILSRQDLPCVREEHRTENVSSAGAYKVRQSENAKLTIMATGSEVKIALDVAKLLKEENIETEVFSVPCLDKFDSSKNFVELVPEGRPCAVIEAGTSESWGRLLGRNGLFFGVESFGASAPKDKLYEKFGLVADKISITIRKELSL